MLSSLLFGLVPALRTSYVDLKKCSRKGRKAPAADAGAAATRCSSSRCRCRWCCSWARGSCCAGSCASRAILPRFDTERLLTADILLGGTKYFDKTPADMNVVTPQSEQFYDRLLEHVRALPGVTRAGIISRLPLQVWTHPFVIVGRPAGSDVRPRRTSTKSTRNCSTRSHPPVARTRHRGTRRRLVTMGRGDQQDVRRSPLPGQNPIGQAIRITIGPSGERNTVENRSPGKSSGWSRT
jgi:hypothetical protein